ncbi:MAG: DNA polymerase III subunit chi [Gammaproteobacteria bacterium]|nr:DNA polymerase III subunit chi [Gammaproteobacteria bacterium]
MTKIFFYILESGRYSPEKLVCGICSKAHQENKKLLLLTQSEQDSNRFDQALWRFDETSFIPHSLAAEEHSLNSVCITHTAPVCEHYTILLNTNNEVPSHFGQYERIIELVHDHNKETARQHYKFYQDRGYPIKYERV